MVFRREGLAGEGERVSGELPGRRPKRVLLIDYDDQLADVLAELLKDDGLEVLIHNCPPGSCDCAQVTAGAQPDAILVNVAQPAGSFADTRGWRCLLNLKSHPLAEHIALIGYSVFDSYALAELGVDGRSLGLRIRSGLSNPGQFADEVARALHTRTAA